MSNVADGSGHRLISMLPGLLAVFATAIDYSRSDQATAILPILGSLVLVAVGFMSPIILTEGFWKPIPNSEALAIGSKGFRTALLAIGICLLFGPGTVRFVARLISAA